MSWLAKLYETYEAGIGLTLAADEKMMPISHTLQNAHINIVIDGNGNFKRASVLEKTQIILPATEKSAGRAGIAPPPHPFADKLQYVAKDYPDFGGEKPSFFSEYSSLLNEWCKSGFRHPKVQAVYEYISRGTVVGDLVREGLLPVDDNRQLRTTWPFKTTDEQPLPTIFRVLPKQKDKRTGDSIIDQGAALVCWSVEVPNDLEPDTWNDSTVQNVWMQFDAMNDGAKGLCFVTGEERSLSTNHPAKLRHTGDKAKLISANDMSGFTFRGRFTDNKDSVEKGGSQSVGISFEVTQKAHNALRWLISRQGYRNGDQVYVAWAVSGHLIPDPLMDSWSLLGEEVNLQLEEEREHNSQIDHTVDVGASFAHSFNKYLAGYRTRLEPNEQIIVIGLDSATPGRMGVIYYRELLASEFLDRIHNWHSQFSWPQRHTKEYSNPKNKKNPVRKTIWPVSTPVPRSIAEAAYGNVLKSNDKLKKSLLERILPCIVDGRPFPRDVMASAVRRACNRNNCEHWEWERNLGVTCALYKGFYQSHPDKNQRRNYVMTLELDRNTRDYLYGRLLAIAECIEAVALSVSGENRPTTAARLMQRFADRPYSTWRNIELGLQPYMQRLQSSRTGFLVNRKKELDAVISAFQADDFCSEKPLSGEFLLGYHCQRMFRDSNTDNSQEK